LIHVAAVGDVQVGRDVAGFQGVDPARLAENADVLLLAGDLTQHGTSDEGALIAAELEALPVPVVAVLGNHDYHHDQEQEIRQHLEGAGVHVLEGEGVVLDIAGCRLGIAGIKGFGGGFIGACGSEFGEPEMKHFMRHTRTCADRLKRALEALDCDVKVALTHYAPVPGTLSGERTDLHPFLGSHLLGEAIDTTGCAVAFHGHAHVGTERARTPAGIPVRNVARPVIQLAYKTYALSTTGDHRKPDSPTAGEPREVTTTAS
jgi:Icc-related predicted phosphoesterase